MRLKEKVLSCVLLFLGFGALFLGFLKIRGGIYGPFWRPPTRGALTSAALSLDQTLALQNKDTDQDGLSDFEEIYVYKTSPYLSDTDSDGLTDKEEIEKGSDPLCSKGQECESYTLKGEQKTNGVQAEAEGGGLPETNGETNNANGVQNEALRSFASSDVENLSVDEIRSLLIKAGMDKDSLKQIDDETLRKVYEETIKEVQTTP